MSSVPRNTILVGDALRRLRELPPGSVDTCITSPPYYQLRDYGTADQLGLESTVNQWVENLRRVVSEVARALKPTGSLWLNLGDSYSRHARYGAPPKSLLLAPERLLLALASDGWIVRNKVIWAKANPMPHSVSDRLSASYEVVYFLVRSRAYYFDLDRIREPHRSRAQRLARPEPKRPDGWAGPLAGKNDGLLRARADGVPGHRLGKNPGDVWRLAASSFRGAHFATFPEALVERPLLATCPEAVCVECGQPWRRRVTLSRLGTGREGLARMAHRTAELAASCTCGAASVPGVVLDPFIGSGTVAVVATRHGRDWIGIELNPVYAALGGERLRAAGHGRTTYHRSIEDSPALCGRPRDFTRGRRSHHRLGGTHEQFRRSAGLVAPVGASLDRSGGRSSRLRSSLELRRAVVVTGARPQRHLALPSARDTGQRLHRRRDRCQHG